MILLFLDDMKERHDRFDAMTEGHEVWHAWDAKQAIDRLGERVYDVAFLDHDLADMHYEDYHAKRESVPNGTGQEVAQFIAQMPADKRPLHVLVHSWNPIGATAIERILRAAGVPVTMSTFGSFTVDAA